MQANAACRVRPAGRCVHWPMVLERIPFIRVYVTRGERGDKNFQMPYVPEVNKKGEGAVPKNSPLPIRAEWLEREDNNRAPGKHPS